MKNNPSVFIIIPNYNGLFHLEYSLGSLTKTIYSNYRVVLVDDRSTDDSFNFVTSNYPNVHIVNNLRLQGFAGAVNSGVLYAIGKCADYIAICNNDIKVLPEWIELIINIFETEKNIGLVGFTEVLKEHENLFYIPREVSYKTVYGLPGCLYVCPSKVFRSVGIYDEAYFMYGEDNDFFHRLTKAGYFIVQTNVPVWHYGEGSSGKQKFSVTWLAYRNTLRFSLKNENLIRIFRTLLALLNQGCNPFLPKKTDSPVFKRMRRYNVVVNFFLIIASCCWNIINIIPTLKSRYEVSRRIR